MMAPTSPVYTELSALRRRDPSWDYHGEPTKRYTHGLHTYPAMMIPQVAARLIERFTGPGETVLDPFCGSGSVLVEASVLGRNAWGIDLNPLAALIARAKTTPIPIDRLRAARDGIAGQLPMLLADPPAPPPMRNIVYWFKPAVIRQLAALRAAVAALADDEARLFFQAALSEVVRTASNTRPGEFKRFRREAIRLAGHDPDAVALFLDQADAAIDRLAAYLAARPAGVWSRVIQADSRYPVTAIPDRSVNAVVTSPPYGDSFTTVAYGDFSSFGNEWLDLDHGRLDDRLLGGSRSAGAADLAPSHWLDQTIAAIAAVAPKRAQEIRAFYRDLAPCLEQIARVLRPGGRAGIVVGNRRVKGVQIPTDLIIAELGETYGLLAEEIIVRRIPTKRLPLRNSPSNVAGETAETMQQEYIVVLSRA